MVLIPEEYLRQAEDRLKVLVLENGLKLTFRKYNELIIYNPLCVQDLRNIYRRVGNEYSTKQKNTTDMEALAEAKCDRQRVDLLTQIVALKDTHTIALDTIQELRTRLHYQDLKLRALRNRM